MNHKRRIHHAIVEVVVTAGVALGYYVDASGLLVPGVIGVTLIVGDRYGTVSPLRGHLEVARHSGPRARIFDILQGQAIPSLLREKAFKIAILLPVTVLVDRKSASAAAMSRRSLNCAPRVAKPCRSSPNGPATCAPALVVG